MSSISTVSDLPAAARHGHLLCQHLQSRVGGWAGRSVRRTSPVCRLWRSARSLVISTKPKVPSKVVARTTMKVNELKLLAAGNGGPGSTPANQQAALNSSTDNSEAMPMKTRVLPRPTVMRRACSNSTNTVRA
jgi:hypothetical protein